MLVSPTEPPAMKVLGQSSSKPETMGVDVAWFSTRLKSWVGVQRKEIKDFIASVNDGRLGKEVAQMQMLPAKLLIIEGRPSFTLDGESMNSKWGAEWTRAQHYGMLWSLQDRGIWVVGVENVGETVEVVRRFKLWLDKGKHQALDRRPGPVAGWGQVGSVDFQRHLVSGLPGIGPELATRIVDEVGVPFIWGVAKEELLKVKGLGKGKVDAMWDLLEEVEFV